VSREKEAELRSLLKRGNTFVLDTSGILAYLHGEEGGYLFRLVSHAASIPFIAITELYYLTWQKADKAKADMVYGLVRGWNIPVVLPEERIILLAGRFKVVYGLGIADSYIAAFASTGNSILFTRDRDYNCLREEIRIFQI
jgi:predicted nucleic acid-binding protein